MEPVSVESFYVALGGLVQRHRKKRSGMTQEKLGQAVGLSRTSITNIEKGRQHIAVHQLVAIATALQTSPEALIPQVTEEHDSTEFRLPRGTDPDLARWVARLVQSPQSDVEDK